MAALGEDSQWELPILTRTIIRDPIYLNGQPPYRFELVLRDYHRLPNNVVIRLVVETNKGGRLLQLLLPARNVEAAGTSTLQKLKPRWSQPLLGQAPSLCQ